MYKEVMSVQIKGGFVSTLFTYDLGIARVLELGNDIRVQLVYDVT